MGGSVIRVNREGRRTFVSDHTAEFSGRPKEEVLSGRFGDTMVPEDRERAWALLMETFRTGAPVSGFVSRQLIRGEERHIMANWAAIKDGDGKIVEVQTTSFDVTEQVRLREQLELYVARMRRAQEEERLAVSRFLHDDTIQALLLVALAVGEVISEGRVEGHDKRTLQRCATTLQDQVEALRRFSMGLRPAILDRMGLDAAIEWFVRETCEAKGVEGVVHIREGWRRLKPSVEVRLFRIVQEAVNNAVRHGSPRKVEVSLVLLDGQLELEVKDDGVGFEPNASHIDLLRGGKLGLVGMQERAKALGAEVRIESKTNAGCRVYLWGSVEKMEQLA
jgi:PAS domain S-box-containing protein